MHSRMKKLTLGGVGIQHQLAGNNLHVWDKVLQESVNALNWRPMYDAICLFYFIEF